ncbi:unnamed protein product [Staurois parvus]|uniref:Uncharacterized protein n=1 Tax=Staurois parvus TaxID=386267 RepID=A0ABN9H2B1_9NEOB|nr:unnamed protein product [Staurois parvus]
MAECGDGDSSSGTVWQRHCGPGSSSNEEAVQGPMREIRGLAAAWRGPSAAPYGEGQCEET